MNSGEHYASELASMEDRNEKYRLIVEALQHIRALTDPTPEQLREASDLALLATGWTCVDEDKHFPRIWISPDEGEDLSEGDAPHPCADLTDAVKWMVPEGWTNHALYWDTSFDEPARALLGIPGLKEVKGEARNNIALALTIAGLAARLEGEK